MRIAERLSSALITIGGIGTVAAIVLIFVFLVGVVLPMFQRADVDPAETSSTSDSPAGVRHLLVDEYGVMAAVLDQDWRIRVLSLSSGRVLDELRPFEAAAPTATSVSVDGQSLVFGFEDGTLRTAEFGFASSFPTAEQSAGLPAVAVGEHVEVEGAILQSTPEGKLRRQSFRFELHEPLELSSSKPIRLVSHVADERGAHYAVWVESAGILMLETSERMNMMTGETTATVDESPVAYGLDADRSPPDHLLLTGTGTELLLVWNDGRCERIDARRRTEASLAEALDLVLDPEESITSLAFLVGAHTILVGTSGGTVSTWFGAKRDDSGTVDGKVFVESQRFRGPESEVVGLRSSSRSRLFAAAFADGSGECYYVTSGKLLARLEPAEVGRLLALCVLPKEDGLLALGTSGMAKWEVDFKHPEVTLASLFRPVWYESYPEPAHSWQAEAATDDFEPKFGFVPLVYGTLKATFYSMIFGAPLAILAAIFTSEFLDRRLRMPIKSTVEMMASLPSVVLGFLAGIVIAPVAQRILPATLAAFVTLPAVLLLAAHVWQLLPQRVVIEWSGWQRLLLMALALPLGALLAFSVAPLAERLLYGGNIELWLDGQIGNAVGGWMFLLLPSSALLVAVFGGRGYQSWSRRRGTRWERGTAARVDIGKFVLGTALVLVLALAGSVVLDAVGLDPRGSFVDTYDSRNALIVGFVMGFAIIPLIYSLAEDALSSVPEHLRLASLGAGATPWQTAVRVIVPTAMSGIFSAVMIGLGRAVGETMIVLMATGNTPIMEMNMFNGFRTLSANIAVELPEAVQGSTHYRALFFAALVLFGLTFVLNTFAEAVRIRFRRRSFQL